MKLILVLFILLFYMLCLNGQTSIEYGPKLGFNLAMHYGTKADAGDLEVQTLMRPGFCAGGYADFRILPHFSLGYELLYTTKGSREKITIYQLENEFGEMETLAKPAKMEVKYYLDYIEVPVLLKIKAINLPRWSMGAVTGTAMGLKIKGDHELRGTFWLPNGDDFDAIPVSEDSDLSEVNMFDFSFVYGGNIELKGKLPLYLEYRFTLGWDYLALPTFQLFEPVQLRNQTYSLIFGTRF